MVKRAELLYSCSLGERGPGRGGTEAAAAAADPGWHMPRQVVSARGFVILAGFLCKGSQLEPPDKWFLQEGSRF